MQKRQFDIVLESLIPRTHR